MNEIRIYTKKVAEYLTERGFNILRMVQSVSNPRYSNWMFMDSPEIRKALKEYKRESSNR